MARYKPYDVDQDKFIPVSFRDQILPGSFEHTLNEIVGKQIDLSPFESRYEYDDTGRLAYEPVFANLQNKGMRRFTLRGKRKVDAQWKLYTLVHNIEKIAHCGAG